MRRRSADQAGKQDQAESGCTNETQGSLGRRARDCLRGSIDGAGSSVKTVGNERSIRWVFFFCAMMICAVIATVRLLFSLTARPVSPWGLPQCGLPFFCDRFIAAAGEDGHGCPSRSGGRFSSGLATILACVPHGAQGFPTEAGPARLYFVRRRRRSYRRRIKPRGGALRQRGPVSRISCRLSPGSPVSRFLSLRSGDPYFPVPEIRRRQAGLYRFAGLPSRFLLCSSARRLGAWAVGLWPGTRGDCGGGRDAGSRVPRGLR